MSESESERDYWEAVAFRRVKAQLLAIVKNPKFYSKPQVDLVHDLLDDIEDIERRIDLYMERYESKGEK